ncbi:MAG: 2-dehydropantoate 2-reductase [Edaphobacter sp.]|uniref:2-dehydropantoate 2-reductase n=1 Tax=Edaphobacter sp. TaxID=1934404 RepID=UPI00238CBABA|nr:2-dehydropantoate 2-reductase [Edaphobacter sp.]MDE1175931.1 2-dehydropantoate 2-reductase [Edaphobacter sp.]
MARIAIVGAGAIGAVAASLLQAAGGHELALCVRRPLAGLVVETTAVGMSSRVEEEIRPETAVKASIWTQPEEASPVDWVLVATKAYDVEAAARWLEWLCGETTPVAVLQNGVEHCERFRPYIPAHRIVPVIVDCPAERREARKGVDRVAQRGPMSLRVPAGGLGEEFVALFAGSQADAAVSADWTTVAWKKLCLNTAGVLSALVAKPAGILREEEMGELALELVRECAAVGRAEGATLDEDIAEQVLASSRRASPDSVNSLLADRLAGRPMEIDARNGAVVRLGKKHGIATPANAMAAGLLRAMAG